MPIQKFSVDIIITILSSLLYYIADKQQPIMAEDHHLIFEDEDDEEILAGLRWIMTVDEMLDLGLLIFFTRCRIDKSNDEMNDRRFVNFYGSSAKVCTIIWEDLQTTTTVEAQIPTNKLSPRYFLMAMNMVKKYPTEIDREGPWDISKKMGREWVWYYLEKIRALQTQKITWPINNFGTDTWAISVDGTHCWIEEPKHPEWSQDSDYYSHKFNKAGINYEIAISLSESRVVWINGPYAAGSNDISIYTQCGLEEKLKLINKKAIGDKGYVGHPNTISTYNVHDCEAVTVFKSRALKRHETFNNMTKRFSALNGRFRHTPDRFETCFESICVICQYQMENGLGLFDVLVEAVANLEVPDIEEEEL